MLPLILSFLGSGAAGAGLLGSMSPLVAGAIGSGVGTAAQTGDLEKGLLAGLGGFGMGAVAGNLFGGATGTAGAVPGTAGAMPTPNMPPAGAPPAAPAAPMVGQGPKGIMGGIFKHGSGLTPPANPAVTGPGFGARLGQIGSGPGQIPFRDVAKSGWQQGVMTPAGMGAAMAPSMLGLDTSYPGPSGSSEPKRKPQADPPNRKRYSPPPGYRAGRDGEHLYFDPRVPKSRYAYGGMVRLAGGGLADIQVPGNPMQPQAGPSEKEILQAAIAAIEEEMPEEQQALVLALFVQTFGEDALRQLVRDVKDGNVPKRDGNRIEGPGGPTDDLVPASIASPAGGQDVLLSDGEYVVPRRGLEAVGEGDPELGADRLDQIFKPPRAMA